MDYCCSRFKAITEIDKSYGLNLRIIRVSEEYIENSKNRGIPVKTDELYNFILTESYDNTLNNKKQSIFINYCPFCGKSLKEYYSKDQYVNEFNHIW